MTVRIVLCLLLGCALGCSATAPPERMGVTFRLEGALAGIRAFAEDVQPTVGGPRIACILDKGQLMISAVKNYGEVHGPGVYLRVAHFAGAGRYPFDKDDRAWVFDDGHIQICGRADDRACYQGNGGCSVELDTWELGPRGDSYPSGVLTGEATGHFACAALRNANTGASLGVFDGTFRCRAEDWTHAGQ